MRPAIRDGKMPASRAGEQVPRPGLRRPALALAALFSLADAATGQAQPQAAKTDATAQLRHYALSACLAMAFPEIAPEARAAQGAYLEFGSHPAEAYQQVVALAAEWLKRDYPSFHNVMLGVMKCIDLSESREVGTIARTTLRPGGPAP